MNDKKLKIITISAKLLTAFIGCIFGLGLTIAGYLMDWGPGGDMNGPLWKILLTGVISSMTGILVALLVVGKLASNLLKESATNAINALSSSVIIMAGGVISFMAGWEAGYLAGKITGTISGLEWKVVLLYVPLMSGIYSIPVSLGAGVLFAVFVFFYLEANKETKP